MRFPLLYPEGDVASSMPATQVVGAPEAPSSEVSTLPPVASTPGFVATKEVPTSPDLSQAHATAYAGFDPSVHKVDAQGTPIMTPTGRFAKKAGIRSNAADASNPSNASARAAAGVKVDHLPIAKQITNSAINLAVWTLGDEWAPKHPDEAMQVAFAFRDYFDARGVPKIPPEVVLLMALASYAGPRLRTDNTRSKIAQWFRKARDFRDSLKLKNGKR